MSRHREQSWSQRNRSRSRRGTGLRSRRSSRSPLREHRRDRRPRSPFAPPTSVKTPARHTEFSRSADWSSSETHYDTKMMYGLSLPRKVESSQFTRRIGIAGRDISEVYLWEVLSQTSQNWCFRLLANGRHSAAEIFRSRGDAVFASTLTKAMYDDPHVDLSSLLKVHAPEGADLTDWQTRLDATKDLTRKLLDHCKTLMPQAAGEHLLKQIEQLRQENAALRASQVSPSDEAHPNRVRLPEAKADMPEPPQRNPLMIFGSKETGPFSNMTPLGPPRWPASKHGSHSTSAQTRLMRLTHSLK